MSLSGKKCSSSQVFHILFSNKLKVDQGAGGTHAKNQANESLDSVKPYLVLLHMYMPMYSAQRQASHGDVIRLHCYRCRQGNIDVSSDSFAVAVAVAATATAAANAAVAISTVIAAPLRMWRG